MAVVLKQMEALPYIRAEPLHTADLKGESAIFQKRFVESSRL
jgi:hypothetical protein